MKEVYSEKGALRAVKFFQDTLSKRNLEGALNNRALILGCMLAYKGECSYGYLRKLLPVARLTLDKTLEDLIKAGAIQEVKEDKWYRFNGPEGNKSDLDVNTEALYLFANALMNVPEYVNTYHVASWNIIAMVIEITLYTERSTPAVKYGTDEMKTVTNPNRIAYRKQLESWGFIKPTGKRSQYRLNKYAYLLGTK